MYGMHRQWFEAGLGLLGLTNPLAGLSKMPTMVADAVDTKEMADQWKRELATMEDRVEKVSGACRLSLKAKLDWLLRRRKDQQ